VSILEIWRLVKLYLALFLVLYLLNTAVAHYFYDDLLNKVGEIQLFLLILFAVCAGLIKLAKRKLTLHYASIFLVSIGVKMMAALIYLMPVILGNETKKEVIALVFMINYLIYLNFFVFSIVQNE